VNVFQGVVWYNKERLEEALRYAGAVAAIASDDAFAATTVAMPAATAKEKKPAAAAAGPDAWPKRLAAIAEAVDAVRKAHAASGYRAEELLAGLTADPAPGRGAQGSLS
jgi:hypothetical protein